MKTHVRVFGLLVFGSVIAAAVAAMDLSPAWERLFEGKNLDQWTISETCGHGNTHAWTVEDDAIVGTQDKVGNGGILLSKETYSDFVLELELNPDFGLDSGIFLRSTPEGKAYQIMVDYYENGNIGGIYGEGLGGFIARADDWKEHYNDGAWNKIVAVIMGNPPSIDVWLNGYHLTSWQDDDKVKLEPEGHVALQVHAGDPFFGKKTRFRNVRIRPLGD